MTGTPDSAPFVDADWIAAHLSDPTVRVIEVDVAPASYRQGHIPGALLWNVYSDLRHPDYSPISNGELERLLGSSGVTRETTVAFYGYGAHLGFWLLKAIGHERVRLLDGPREQWLEGGRRWALDEPEPLPSVYPAFTTDPRLDEARETVLTSIGKPRYILLDVRSDAEYEGERFWPSGATEGAGRPGHVPGSIHLPIEALREADGRFRDAETLRRALAGRGITPESRIVTYCTIGNRASQAWLPLRYLLGYPDTAVYFGSWAEWGLLPGAPVETAFQLGPPTPRDHPNQTTVVR